MKTTTLYTPQYGLDIDGVLANFIQALIAYAKSFMPEVAKDLPATWHDWMPYDSPNPEAFRKVYNEISYLPSFWLNIEPLEDAVADVKSLPFLPTVYITSRPIPTEVTQEWLFRLGFPTAPVVTAENATDKIEVAKAYGLTHFVDDLPTTCEALNAAGIKAYLFDQPHNVSYVPSPGIERIAYLNGMLAHDLTSAASQTQEHNIVRPPAPAELSLTEDAAERNSYPMAEGLLYYFPNALAEVSRVSKIGNEQHNPGEPMHWARGKSTDHANKIMRHLIDAGKVDKYGVRHSAALAWRALAMLQEELERDNAAIPLPRNARII